MRFAHCTYGGKRPCCSAHFCPLVPAWASTIHKFQGFEAGKDDWDLIKTLIIDCGPINAEWLTPGLLYVAASRGKTWGSMSKTNPRPTDSAIYFDKEGMGENRVRHVAVHQKKVSKDNFQWVKNKNVQKRDMWVKFLMQKAEETKRDNYPDEKMNGIKRDTVHTALSVKRHCQTTFQEAIANMVNFPNEHWAKKRKDYMIPQGFFR